MRSRLAVILLAAGEASRYGHNKLLASHPQSASLLAYQLDQYAPLSEMPVIVVTGAWYQDIANVLAQDKRAQLVYNPNWQSGMASSIRCGVQWLQQHCTDVSHCLIGLGDLASVTTHSLQALVDASTLHPDRVIASQWQEKLAAPAIFPAQYFSQLLTLEGDKGAGPLLKHLASTTPPTCIGVAHPQAQWDIDRPSDWTNLQTD